MDNQTVTESQAQVVQTGLKRQRWLCQKKKKNLCIEIISLTHLKMSLFCVINFLFYLFFLNMFLDMTFKHIFIYKKILYKNIQLLFIEGIILNLTEIIF